MWASAHPCQLPQLARWELKDELFGANHPELVPGDAFHVSRIGAQRFNLALESGDFANQLFVGFTKLLNLPAKVTIAGQALLIEHQGRDRHDGHHHQ